MRTPTDQERQKERSIAFTFFIDVGVVLLIVIFAIMTSSLTLISEGVRSSLMLLLLFYSLRVLKSVHRGKLVHLEFGAAKLENFIRYDLFGARRRLSLPACARRAGQRLEHGGERHCLARRASFSGRP